jgi:DNA gyrase subunit B
MSDGSPAGDKPTTGAAGSYGPVDLRILSPLECIRKRPGLYIGGTDVRALHWLVHELIDNAVLETQGASGRDIHVTVYEDGSCRIVDSGAGLPVDVLPQHQRTVVELLLTGDASLGTDLPGTFRGGPLGCFPGLVVNALSERLQIEVRRDGSLWRQEYRRGQPSGPLQTVMPSVTTGTAVSFRPDPEIFTGDRQLQFAVLEGRLRQLAFLNPGLTFHLSDERQTPAHQDTYQSANGLADYVRFLNRDRDPVQPNVFQFRTGIDGGEVEAALQWTSGEGSIESFADYQPTRLGVTHVEGFLQGLREALLDGWRERGALADVQLAPNGEDCRAGLTAVLSVRLQEPYFVMASRERLCNPEVIAPIRQATRHHLGRLLATHPADAEAIFRRVLRARNERQPRRK